MDKKLKIFMISIIFLLIQIIITLFCINLPSIIAYPLAFLLGMPTGSLTALKIIDIINS